MIYILAAAAAAVIIVVFCYYQNNKIDVTEYIEISKDIKNPVTLVQLSDLHSKPFKKVLQKLDEIKPDIIAITGDFINDKGRNREKMMRFGKELLDRAPVFYITGNHERRLEYFDTLMDDLKALGFTILLNDTAQIRIGSSTITFLGLDENQADFKDYKARKNGTFKYKDMSPYFKELDKYTGYKVVLSHFPENFEMVEENNYSQYDFDLQLSGHAHGGQFILPIIGPVFSPGQGLFPKYARGAFGERPKMIVSRGLGNAEFPLRLFNHPEINVIYLEEDKFD
ncbi:MAG TPA: metallophosphoesterase [Candidatus Eubacterium faecavium]|nr:metallophosphoesterase [Candidatus Eubacterium faecavium]